jgi:hypothetical protein
VAEGEVDRACRLESLAQQALHRLEDGNHRDLVVERAAPPDEAFGDVAAEGAVRPLSFGSRNHRHDILVAH